MSLSGVIVGCGRDAPPSSPQLVSKTPSAGGNAKNHQEWEAEVERLSQASDFKGVVAACSRILATEPRNVSALVWRSYGYMETGLLSKALDDIAAALAIDPSSAAAWAAKGDAHLRLHSTEDEISMKYYDRAIALNQHCEAAWRSRARLFAKEQSYRQAIRDYSRLIEISGKHADVFERGLALQASNQHDAAIRDFNLAIERKADVPAYYGRRSISWSKIGQFDNAIADVGTAINLDKDNPSGFSHRAVYRVRQGDLRLAITDWLVSIELTENHAGFNYQPLRENPPAQEMLHHGEGQLLAMLRDRPEMATFVKQGDRLWIWAVRKLAGEDVGEPVYWNPETLKYHPARHSYPAPQSVGWIQISSDSAVRADGDGTAFEHLWACLAFELHNMTFAKDFADVVERVSAGDHALSKLVTIAHRPP